MKTIISLYRRPHYENIYEHILRNNSDTFNAHTIYNCNLLLHKE